MTKHPASAAAFLAAAVLISACGENSPLENSSDNGSKTVIAAVGGTALSGYFGNFVSGVPQARVTDRKGAPLAGVTVTFEALGGGHLTGTSAVTDSTGQASPTSWRLGTSGTQSVRVRADDAAPFTFTAAASSPPAAAFRIEVRYAAGTTPSATQKAAFESAAAKWSAIILRGGAPYPVYEDAGCGDIRGETVDGVVITADLKPIDGSGNILGSAGPCILRDADYLPAQGYMQFDTDDLAMMETRGALEPVILHEMAHVLGFGTIWDLLAMGGRTSGYLLRTPPEDPTFVGLASRFALFGLAGPAFAGFGSVPVENTGAPGTAYAHWREATFGQELMTGWLNPGTNPLSALTIAQFRDLGYTVNDALGETYSFAAAIQAQVQSTTPIQLTEGKLMMPVLVINRAGRTVRTIQRIYK